MQIRKLLVLAMAAGFAHTSLAADANPWPTSIDVGDGWQVGVKSLLQYDSNRFDDDRLPDGSDRFDDAQTWRRKEVNLFARKQGLLTINAGYDFQARSWLDNYVAVETGAGRFRLGQFKTPVGWEDGNISSDAITFLERSLPEQAVNEGRRVGVEWLQTGQPKWVFQLAAFGRHNLNNDAAGNTVAGRVVYTPILEKERVLHLGISASREWRDDRTARVRARPEVALTPVRLVDTGMLQGVDRINRIGLESAWIDGPLLLQGEYLTLQAVRPHAADHQSRGAYLSGSWLLTGESRGYKAGTIANPKPGHDWGALEIALRYATLDLNDGGVTGGREHDWTLGVNWYLGSHFKLQANYIRAFSDRGNLPLDPTIVALRAQLAF